MDFKMVNCPDGRIYLPSDPYSWYSGETKLNVQFKVLMVGPSHVLVTPKDNIKLNGLHIEYNQFGVEALQAAAMIDDVDLKPYVTSFTIDKLYKPLYPIVIDRLKRKVSVNERRYSVERIVNSFIEAFDDESLSILDDFGLINGCHEKPRLVL